MYLFRGRRPKCDNFFSWWRGLSGRQRLPRTSCLIKYDNVLLSTNVVKFHSIIGHLCLLCHTHGISALPGKWVHRHLVASSLHTSLDSQINAWGSVSDLHACLGLSCSKKVEKHWHRQILTGFVAELAFKVMHQYKSSIRTSVRGYNVRLKSGKFVAGQVFDFLSRPHFATSTLLRPSTLQTHIIIIIIIINNNNNIITMQLKYAWNCHNYLQQAWMLQTVFTCESSYCYSAS